MSTRTKIEIFGDKALMARLDRLPDTLRKRVLRPAVTAAGRPVRQAAKANVPIRFGFLKKAIDVKAKSYKTTAVAIVGPRSDMSTTGTNLFGQPIRVSPSLYAHLVEGGVRPHAMPWGPGGKGRWMHPGNAPKRFLERAWESQLATAQAKLNQKIAEGLEKHA